MEYNWKLYDLLPDFNPRDAARLWLEQGVIGGAEWLEHHDISVFEKIIRREAGTTGNCDKVSRQQLIEIAEKIGQRPRFLYPEERETAPENPLHENERRTLLNIIRALAQLSRIEPVKKRATGDGWRKAAESLLADLASKGIDAPVKDPQTLTEKLREAFSLRG